MAVITYFEGAWVEGSPRIMGSMAQSFMHGSTVFDGARAFSGTAPDLDRHCARLIHSAEVMGLAPGPSAEEVTRIAVEGIGRFAPGSELYIRPALFSDKGFLVPDPDETCFAMTIFEVPMPTAGGFSVCLSAYRRPNPDMAPTDAKASCLYPITSLAIAQANAKGFDNAIMRDGAGNVVEFASSNLWIAKDGLVSTPAHNHTFLNGITRQRLIALLRGDGLEVRETPLTMAEVLAADEVFSTGNLGKVLPVNRVEDRDLQPGPICARARELYFAFARGQGV
ncbi:MAG: branched-chain amino acid aminotransferase [Alphaproteobacteria bacterium]|jgi:branched-chain amino acid aminotransferase|nr:branched-chain amino acid aminotransferase [Alphaproteobacteria bacterium]MDP6517346.1 branched-chain amino acid aminotransferase [Alphaproteobacteria bacterium]